jgi:hypothetical protein
LYTCCLADRVFYICTPKNTFVKFYRFLAFPLMLALSGQAICQQDTVLKRDSSQINRIPLFSVSGDDADSDRGGQDVSGLLQSSRDLYASTAGFHFGTARFRIRGYNTENFAVLINGVKLNDPETGLATFANWGGLNDVTRFQEMRPYLQESRYTFSGVGGYSHIEARAGSMRPGTSVSYASSNRIFRHRLMFTHSTGYNANGWAFTVSGSRRWAEEGFVEGTFFDAWSYFAAAEKKFNNRHSLNLIAFGAPIRQGRQGFAVQEAYDLAGTNFYNPNWGYQDGKKRNARVSNNHAPVLILSHIFKPDEKTKFTGSLFYSYGRNGYTNLNWYEAADPRPDYYRYLPSYYSESDPERAGSLSNLWQNDVNTRQINWDQFYFANSKNLYQVNNPNGKQGEVLIGNRSKYVLEESIIDRMQGGLTLLGTRLVNEALRISGGANALYYTSRNYKVMNDLLGGDFWLDVDQFAERDFDDPDAAENDLNNPNNVIEKGDVFGFDYNIHQHQYMGFAQLEYSKKTWEMYVSAHVSNTSFWREGNMVNGRFPETSFGNSDKQNYTNGGAKAGFTWKINGRHYAYVNAAYYNRAPLSRESFLSPRIRPELIPGLRSETVASYDINYQIRYPKFKLRITWFHTQFSNQVWYRNFYHDDFRNLVNYTMTGLGQLNQGLEFAAEHNVYGPFTLQLVASRGLYIYNSRPVATIVRDNSAELLAENRTIYLKNFRVGGMPQTAVSLGLKYNGRKGWWGGIYLNYFDDIYAEPNPDRRSAEALQKFVTSDPQWDQLIGQEKFDPAITVDISLGKSFRVKDNFLNISLNINNALNNQDFVVSAFEQLRYDSDNINKFPQKLVYNLGAIYNLVIGYRF